MPKFRVELIGAFYTFELYDDRGREIFELGEAVEAAESQYPGTWRSVFNGEVGQENLNLQEVD